MPLKLTYNPRTDVAYLSLRDAGSHDVLGPPLEVELSEFVRGGVLMDFTFAEGLVAGFEFSPASLVLPAALLAAAERSDADDLSNRPQVVMLGPVNDSLFEGRRRWLHTRRRPH